MGGEGLGEKQVAKGELGSAQFCRDWEEQGCADQSLTNLNAHTIRPGRLFKCRF